jgi:hypothetical protein
VGEFRVRVLVGDSSPMRLEEVGGGGGSKGGAAADPTVEASPQLWVAGERWPEGRLNRDVAC